MTCPRKLDGGMFGKLLSSKLEWQDNLSGYSDFFFPVLSVDGDVN